MKPFLKVIISIICALYPVLVFAMLVVYKLPVRIISLCVIFLGLVYFISSTSKDTNTNLSNNKKFNSKNKKEIRFDKKSVFSSLFFLTAGIICYVTNNSLFLKFYPVVVTLTMLFVFGLSLFNKPNIIFRFACLQDKSIKSSYNKFRIEKYCYKVTIVWICFFVINSVVATLTAVCFSEKIWTLYNCAISYCIMGSIFLIEFIIRGFVNRKMPKLNFISKFTSTSRKDDDVICFEGNYSQKKYKYWIDFLTDSAKLRNYFLSQKEKKFILHCNDYYLFTCCYVALFQAKKEIALTANVTKEFIKEMRQADDGFVTDVKDLENSIYLPELVASLPEPTQEQIRNVPQIDADETKIYMFTSGSTGTPKAILQRLTEFENDNEFIFTLWGDEFLKRKVISTLSHHHIYGLLFSVMLPFACGVPYRTKRVEFPEEFESLTDTSYFVVAVPAFLKRTVESIEKLEMKEPFIVTSGGVLLKEVAEKTEKVFGFWPMEVYGSTETSGIGYRQSKNGPEWTSFDNATLSVNEEGCLNIKSPYIKDENGFQTADLVELYDNGKFLLKGRKDSIVKIEEKRVSLTEVENRLLQTGLVKDVCVLAMSDRRQYLVCALSFNDKGKEKFSNVKKLDINNYFSDFLKDFFENVVIPKKWRFVEELPLDLQGKKKKNDIIELFTK